MQCIFVQFECISTRPNKGSKFRQPMRLDLKKESIFTRPSLHSASTNHVCQLNLPFILNKPISRLNSIYNLSLLHQQSILTRSTIHLNFVYPLSRLELLLPYWLKYISKSISSFPSSTIKSNIKHKHMAFHFLNIKSRHMSICSNV